MVNRNHVGSANPDAELAPQPRRRALACALTVNAVIVALLMLTVSFSPIVTAAGSSSSSQSYSVIADDSKQPSDKSNSWKTKEWDWQALADEDGFVRVIVSVHDTTPGTKSSDASQGKLKSLMGEKAGYLKGIDSFAAELTIDSLDSLLSDPDFEVYPDLVVEAFLTESVSQVGAEQLWAMRDTDNAYVTGTGIVVAVIDTGVDYTHPDLGGGLGPTYKVIGGYDFVNDDSDPIDDNGHGTHCAGIIAASGGITGVAPGASILAYKALDAAGQGYMSDVIMAIDRAMDPNDDGDMADHADVISMSLGGPGETDDPVCTAVRNAVEAGVIVVVAAGNEGPSMGTVASPGLAAEAITVGAIDKSDNLANFSSRGTIPDLAIKPEISAPGVSITSTVPYSGTRLSSPTGYFSASGTSMATPHVAGGAALLLQLHPTWAPEQVKSALVTGSYELDESIWAAGAGGMWLPEAAGAQIFLEPALVSYGSAGDPGESVTVSNSGSFVTIQTSSEDWSSMLADGSAGTGYWTNVSSVSPASFSLSSSGSSAVSLSVSIPTASAPEGFYDGSVLLDVGAKDVRLPFGFVVLSTLNVHVLSATGTEINDPYGGVWVYSVPDADIALGRRGSVDKPVPPATMLIPSGTYNVHSIGHQLLYDFSDPYVLSSTVTVPRLGTVDVYLSIADATAFTLDLATADGNPIYVKDFRAYCRYEGTRNISFHIVGSDYSVKGSDIFTLPTSKTVYISDTDVEVGISVSGFSYSAGMWDFMSRNWNHWFEYVSGTSTEFLVEASTDLQYLIAWEFEGIDSSTQTSLGLVEGQYSVYETKYDIPGTLTSVWSNWGTNRAAGGDAVFYTRRDSDTSLNPFYSGMTRTTIVQGVFSELYYPGNLFSGFIERSFYNADYSHLLRADTAAEIYVPDRNYIEAIPGLSEVERIGVGPFYPSLTTMNTNESLVMVQPLLRDQSGAKVGGMTMPTFDLFKNGQLIGMYQFPEFLARPDALRVIPLTSAGQYVAIIDYEPFPQICSNVQMALGFTVPSIDVNPPQIVDLSLPQRFVPGTAISLSMQAEDSQSSVNIDVSWRTSESSPWQSLAVAKQGLGEFSTIIQTSSADQAIHLMIRATDMSGNYIEFLIDNAALAQVPVSLHLAASQTEVGYRNSDVYVVLTGYLEDQLGNPLSSLAGVPVELVHDGEKIGMILDEYCTASSHTHNGSIRFEWHFNPVDLFTGPGETADIQAVFDLGIYQPATETITLTSIEFLNDAPLIALISPANGSLNAAGTELYFSIADDGSFNAEAFVDGASVGALSSPWSIGTTGWSDGPHAVRIVAIDNYGSVSSASFSFDIDASNPSVEILYPSAGARIPMNSVLSAYVYDMFLSTVTYSADGAAAVPLAAPYTIPLTGWSEGVHTVSITATDAVGKTTSRSVAFEIATSTVVLEVLSPANGAVIRSGTTIELAAVGADPVTCRWYEGGVWHELGSARSISTAGWTEGAHSLLINATDTLNGFDEVSFSLTIDNTPPQISLISPGNGTFVEKTDQPRISVSDGNFASVNWSLWGIQWRSTNPEVYVSLMSCPGDGYFTIQMTATDLAGNRGSAIFVFAMDNSAPAITVENIAQGGALRPGTDIDAGVTDAFLMLVQYSVDSAAMSNLASPYDIETADLQSGPHVLRISASDASGKSSTLDFPFYVDSSAPVAAIGPGDSFPEDSTYRVTANATDDFTVGSVSLCLELSSGAFTTLPMALEDGVYVSLVPASMLWDGMEIYAVAVDTAGNSGETSRVTLHSISGPVDDGTGGTTSDAILSLGPVEWVAIASLAAALGVGIIMVIRRRRDEEPEESKLTITQESKEPRTALKPAPAAPVKAAEPVPERNERERRVGGEAMHKKSEIRTHYAQDVLWPEDRPTQVPLIEAIPEVTLKAEPAPEQKADDVDYGELIERELIIPGREGSVYKDTEENQPPRTDFEVLREIMDELGRFGPKKPRV